MRIRARREQPEQQDQEQRGRRHRRDQDPPVDALALDDRSMAPPLTASDRGWRSSTRLTVRLRTAFCPKADSDLPRSPSCRLGQPLSTHASCPYCFKARANRRAAYLRRAPGSILTKRLTKNNSTNNEGIVSRCSLGGFKHERGSTTLAKFGGQTAPGLRPFHEAEHRPALGQDGQHPRPSGTPRS